SAAKPTVPAPKPNNWPTNHSPSPCKRIPNRSTPPSPPASSYLKLAANGKLNVVVIVGSETASGNSQPQTRPLCRLPRSANYHLRANHESTAGEWAVSGVARQRPQPLPARPSLLAHPRHRPRPLTLNRRWALLAEALQPPELAKSALARP